LTAASKVIIVLKNRTILFDRHSMSTVLDALVTSRTRVQILMRLFFNAERQAYLRELALELDVSPSQVSEELKHLDKAGLVSSTKLGRQVHYRASTEHALVPELQSMVRKALGTDRILDSVIDRLGQLQAAFVVGPYAHGRDTGIIGLILVGDVNDRQLADLAAKTERYIRRKIRTLALRRADFDELLESDSLNPRLGLWQVEER
jgi:DNA-binding transcriptional ArsR family regulator